MPFEDLGLSEEVLRAVSESGYTEPTPIQAQAIPYVLMGKDILGCAQTGTGKTAGFTLPMIDVLAHGRAKARMPRSLILEPTRELAAQVADSFDKYGKYHKLTKALLIGGESMDAQIKAMERGVDVLIATPGRLLDLFDRGRLLLTDVKILVIDEADRMLDMGFIPDVERIVTLVSPIRQTLFFSATMPPEIRRLADAFLMHPKEITVAAPSSAAETVEQALCIVQHGDGRKPGGGAKEKRAALRVLLNQEKPAAAIIFCNRKRDVGIVTRSLNRHGYDVDQLHGDMAQSNRMEVLAKFKDNAVKLLVCSDVAARGLDIPEVSHVFNFDVPTHSEDYVHRIGRTGRAGRSGKSFSIAVPEDGKYIASIENMLGREIPRIDLSSIPGADLEAAPRGRGRRGKKADDRKPTEGRKRSEGRGRGKAEPEPQAEAEPAPEKTEAPEEPKSRRPRRKAEGEEKPREKRDGRREKSVVGMGDHVPAFMLRSALPGKAKS